jgi:Transcriptional regulatory protein, C terminal
MAEKKIHFGQFELDFGRFQLSRAGEPVRLEGLPLRLLMYLIDHHRERVTREQIADALWGKDVFVDVEMGINTAVRKVRLRWKTIRRSRSICRRWWGMDTDSSLSSVPQRKLRRAQTALKCHSRSLVRRLWLRPGSILKNGRLHPKIHKSRSDLPVFVTTC